MREAPAGLEADGGSPVSEFFAALGDGWRLTSAQQARLSPAVSAALGTGWTPGALAAFTGANTADVLPIRDPGHPALARRASRAARSIGTSALVRAVRPGYADAGLPRRCFTPMRALQDAGMSSQLTRSAKLLAALFMTCWCRSAIT